MSRSDPAGMCGFDALKRMPPTNPGASWAPEVILELKAKAREVRGVRIERQAPFLRHFTAELRCSSADASSRIRSEVAAVAPRPLGVSTLAPLLGRPNTQQNGPVAERNTLPVHLRDVSNGSRWAAAVCA